MCTPESTPRGSRSSTCDDDHDEITIESLPKLYDIFIENQWV
jgi:hypothetical protein